VVFLFLTTAIEPIGWILLMRVTKEQYDARPMITSPDHCSRNRMQQSKKKKRKKSRILDLEKNAKTVKTYK